MTLRRWKNAIRDFEMSLEHGYKDGDYRLHHKIGQCYVKLKKYQSATKSFQAALGNLKTAKVDPKVETQFTKILKECIGKFSSKAEECCGSSGSDIVVKNPMNHSHHKQLSVMTSQWCTYYSVNARNSQMCLTPLSESLSIFS